MVVTASRTGPLISAGPTNLSTDHRRRRGLRYCTSTATRSTTRLCSRGSVTKAGPCSSVTDIPTVEGSDPQSMHQAMAATLGIACRDRKFQQERARPEGFGPLADGDPPQSQGLTAHGRLTPLPEGFWRAHQIPIADIATNPSHLKVPGDGCGATNLMSFRSGRPADS